MKRPRTESPAETGTAPRIASPSAGLTMGIGLALALSACSVATLGGARPVDVGTHQVVVAPSMVRIARGGQPYVGPQLEIGERYGLSKRADIGVRLWLPMPGYIVDTRVSLRRSAEPDHGLDVALQPGTSYLYVPGGDANSAPLHIATLSLPVLVGWQFGHGRQVVVAGKVLDILAVDTTSGSDPANILSVAGTLGLVWPLTEQVALAPEVGLGAAVLGSLAGFGSTLGVSGTTLQFSLGLLLGGRATAPVRCVELSEGVTPQ